MNDVEEVLRRTFARADARVPTMPPDLLRQVTVRQARRRRRGLVLAAAAATALVVGVTSAVAWWAPEPRPIITPRLTVTAEQTPPPVPKPRIVKEIAPPLEQVLPAVTAEVPRKVPNGKAFTPRLFIDPRSVLGYVAKKGYDPEPELWAYNLNSRNFQRLATVTPSVSLAVGEGLIAWSKNVGQHIHIMTIPVTGGTPHKVVSFAAEVDADKVHGDTRYGVGLTIGDGKIFWASARSGGVHQVPVSGGEPSFTPGTEGLELFRWPWAGRRADGPMSRMTRLLNLSTGERLDNPARARCDVSWCLTDTQATHRDGGQVVNLPGNTRWPLVADRFVIIDQVDQRRRPVTAIFDLATSRVGRLWIRNGHRASPTLHIGADMLHFKRGDKWFVVHDPDR